MTDGLKLLCGKCDHVWVACALPIEVDVLVKATEAATCPQCANHHLFIYTGPRAALEGKAND
jgi:hypothetical protein